MRRATTNGPDTKRRASQARKEEAQGFCELLAILGVPGAKPYYDTYGLEYTGQVVVDGAALASLVHAQEER